MVTVPQSLKYGSPFVNIAPAPQSKRVMRRPAHSFHLRHRPYQIQPFLIAPTLPGETLKNVLMQARCVTDPVKNPLIGWNLEYYLFHVPLRCIPASGYNAFAEVADIEQMLLNINTPLSDSVSTSLPFYQVTADGGVDWVRGCLASIVQAFFRDSKEQITSEPLTDNLLDGVPQAHVTENNMFDSLMNDDEADDDLGGEDVVSGNTVVAVSADPFTYQNLSQGVIRVTCVGTFTSNTYSNTAGATDVLFAKGAPIDLNYGDSVEIIGGNGTASLYISSMAVQNDIDGRYETWLMLRQQNMINMEYEDYLATFGVRKKRDPEIKPELIRYLREWTYPSNTIDPTNGTPRSALSWAVTLRADKDRFFKEPGFVFGVTVARPKIYMSKQTTFGSSVLKDCLSWLPAIMRERCESSLKKFVQATGPYGVQSDANNKDYWLDIRDLFNYGDQYVNFALSDTSGGLVGLPAATHAAQRYAPDADIDALFVGSTDATRLVRQDGIVNLHVLGTQQDYTP